MDKCKNVMKSYCFNGLLDTRKAISMVRRLMFEQIQ